MVVAGAVQAKSSLEVQELAHEVEVGGDVRLLAFDEVVGIVEGEVELLHQVRHGDGDGAADPGQTVNQDATLFGACFVWKEEEKSNLMSNTTV